MENFVLRPLRRFHEDFLFINVSSLSGGDDFCARESAAPTPGPAAGGYDHYRLPEQRREFGAVHCDRIEDRSKILVQWIATARFVPESYRGVDWKNDGKRRRKGVPTANHQDRFQQLRRPAEAEAIGESARGAT